MNNLWWLSSNSNKWDKQYIQTININAGDTQNWNNGSGFRPVGPNSDNRFSGRYNGQEYYISNLYINRPNSDYVGLFGYLNGYAYDLNVLTSDITGQDNTGLLAGYSGYFSTIYGCNVSGSVTGGNYVGGITGEFDGSRMDDCHSSGSVTGSSSYVGGLVGELSGEVKFCSSSSTVSGSGCVGGLVR